MNKSHYEILGVSQNASLSDIKSAYRKLALKYHPDINKDEDAQQYFLKINEAYNTLSDSVKRAYYDQLLDGEQLISTAVSSQERYRSYLFKRKRLERQRKEIYLKLIKRYLPYAEWSSRVVFMLCLLVCLDYFLPSRHQKERVTDFHAVPLSDGKIKTTSYKFPLAYNEIKYVEKGDLVEVYTTPIFNIYLKIVILSDERSALSFNASYNIYSTFFFILATVMLCSGVGTFYNKYLEFSFNLGVTNLILGIILIFLL